MTDHNVAPPSKKSRKAQRPDARIAKSRRALHAALVDLVTEMPFEEVTAAAITARAGIGYATFFRHYPTREALLAEIADALIGELLILIAPFMSAQDTGAAALALTHFVDDRRRLCQALLVGAGDAMRRDITARAVAAAGSAGTSTPEWLPHKLGIVHGVAATLTILGWWLEQGKEQGAVAIADVIDRLVFAPMAAPSEQRL
ncbi:TetR/AcrR family transcriptional regulator [Sphingomonas abietis]|uniref:TetR/AcrR family transcriptional regulator n=1 Tax=Sphingomonas abietis TaxID=3012344 RepID=A0ABY7NQV2_9SPHN|nr:TetR/AcrR family transcriptional regulator [Sphingomonas abietis]WBO23190.1 TetR/AcrR family transcriptional regulator [Sphingomonas abietis]